MKKCRNILIVTEIISVVILIVYNILDEHADYNYKTIYRDGKIISTTWFDYVDGIVSAFADIALIVMLTVSVTGYNSGSGKEKRDFGRGEAKKHAFDTGFFGDDIFHGYSSRIECDRSFHGGGLQPCEL